MQKMYVHIHLLVFSHEQNHVCSCVLAYMNKLLRNTSEIVYYKEN